MSQRTLPAGFIAPCLPTKTDKLLPGSQWLHEIVFLLRRASHATRDCLNTDRTGPLGGSDVRWRDFITLLGGAAAGR
jgi:hypothetical protein